MPIGLVISLLFISLFAVAQESGSRENNEDAETLFDQSANITGFGSLETRFTRVVDQDAIMIGARGGVIFDGHFFLGIGASGLVTSHTFEGSAPEQDLHLGMGYAGLIMGVNIAPKKVFHFAIPLLVGAGNVEITSRQEGGWEIDGVHYSSAFIENSTFLIFEPGIRIEVNLTRFMKLGLGGSYRLLHGVNLENNISNNDLSYWAGQFSVIFGRFL
jgi:hypothetical protein